MILLIFQELKKKLNVTPESLRYQLTKIKKTNKLSVRNLEISHLEAVTIALRMNKLYGEFSPKKIAHFLQTNFIDKEWNLHTTFLKSEEEKNESNIHNEEILLELEYLIKENDFLKNKNKELYIENNKLIKKCEILDKKITKVIKPEKKTLYIEKTPEKNNNNEELIKVLEDEYYALQKSKEKIEKEKKELEEKNKEYELVLKKISNT